MFALPMERGYLPWNSNAAEERLFHKTLLIVMAVALLLGLLIPLLELPPPDREREERVPARLARFLLERHTPPAAVKKVREEVQAEAKKPQPEEKAESKPQAPKSRNQAREVAARSGVLALASEFSALRASGAASKAKQRMVLSSGAVATEAVSERVVASAARGSEGIDTSGYQRDTGRGGALGEHRVARAEAVNPTLVEEEAFKRVRQPQRRDQETVIRVLDANKGRIYAIYNRALRKNPLLAGRLLLELTIDPSGKVSSCRVISSELNDRELEQRLITRIKMLQFGAEKVPPYKFEYPIEFLPS